MTRTPRSLQLISAIGGAVIWAMGGVSLAQPGGDQPYLAVGPAAEAALGIGSSVSIREDARRTKPAPTTFEWWYFDGVFSDGTIIVGWFGDNWPYGLRIRAVNFEITRPGQPTRTVTRTFVEPGSFSTDRADVRIGRHRFEGDLDTYKIYVDPSDTGGIGCDLTLRRRVPSYRPGTGHVLAGQSYFAWLVAVPEGEMSGTLSIDGKTQRVMGRGYHDHNWGNVYPGAIFDRWWWGRANAAGQTLIVFDLQKKKKFGGDSIAAVFVGAPGRHVVNAYGDKVTVTPGVSTPHPDGRHVRPIPSSLTFSTPDGVKAKFALSSKVLSSVDVLPDSARKAPDIDPELKPWYSRFASSTNTTLPGRSAVSGPGILEYYEMR